MHSMKIPVVLLSALALAAPGATSYAKDKGKNKDKDKSAQHDDRSGNADRSGNDDRGGHGEHHGDDDKGGKVTICHIPGGNPGNRRTLSVGASAWDAHKAHGDYRGACRDNHPGPGDGGRFDALDRNDDGVISQSEWAGDAGSFDRLDRNDDGVISRREFERN